MSDDNNQRNKPNPLGKQQIRKTSAVPLRKETVRVTLKAPGAKPGAVVPPSAPTGPVRPSKTPTVKLGDLSAQAPKPKAPSAGPPKPSAAPPKPSAPSAPSAPAAPAPRSAPPVPAATIPLGNSASFPKAMTPGTDKVPTKVDLPDVTSAVPLKQETMRVTLKADKSSGPVTAAAPAPTIPLGNASTAPKPAVAAPTIPLGNAASVPLATQPLEKSNASQPLPKATVQLQQTQQLTQGLGSPSQAATIQTVSDDDVETKRGSGAALPLTIIAFLVSLVVLYCGFTHAKIWVEKHKDGDMMTIFEAPEGE